MKLKLQHLSLLASVILVGFITVEKGVVGLERLDVW